MSYCNYYKYDRCTYEDDVPDAAIYVPLIVAVLAIIFGVGGCVLCCVFCPCCNCCLACPCLRKPQQRTDTLVDHNTAELQAWIAGRPPAYTPTQVLPPLYEQLPRGNTLSHELPHGTVYVSLAPQVIQSLGASEPAHGVANMERTDGTVFGVPSAPPPKADSSEEMKFR